ncbi:MAG TPA: hypothetical protein VKP65_02055 [Rhodothermales bacterium]|nr:hypothetical protein [Rhodothermales bacterium]
MLKRITTGAALFALCFMLVAGANAAPSIDKDKTQLEKKALAELTAAEAEARTAARWEAFNTNLVAALQSDMDGVKSAAMQMVIRYGDQVNVDKALFDVVRIYRDHDNDNMRRMAVVALGAMNHPWGLDFLERSQRFEKSPKVQQTLYAVVAQHRGGGKVRF